MLVGIGGVLHGFRGLGLRLQYCGCAWRREKQLTCKGFAQGTSLSRFYFASDLR